MKTALPFALALSLLAVTGCSTIDSRINEKAPLFYSLDAATRAKIAHGDIDLTFTPDMVYIALGEPDAKRQRVTGDGTHEVWIYSTYYERYEGSANVGYHRWVSYDAGARLYRVYWSPVYRDIYSEHREDKVRVTFTNGKVSAIDQAKDN